MTIKELLQTKDPKSSQINDLVALFHNDLKNTLNNPMRTAYDIFNNEYNAKRAELVQAVVVNTNMKCFIQQYQKFNLITEVLGRKTKALVNIDKTKFIAASLEEIAMLVDKYENVFGGQIVLALYTMFTTNAPAIYKDGKNLYLTDEFRALPYWIEEVMNIDTQYIPKRFDKGRSIKRTERRNNAVNNTIIKIKKPSSPKQLQLVYIDGMTRREWVRAIANYYDVSEKQAERWLKEFGMWEDIHANVIDWKQECMELREEVKRLNARIEGLINRCEYLENELQTANDHNKYLENELKKLRV